MFITVRDKAFKGLQSARVYDDNNFLRVPARAARIGIQKYLASELGLTDRNPLEVINVYRPPNEVFAGDSLTSYKDVDITIEHPNEMVSSETYDAVSVGHVTSEGRREGDWVVCDLIIKAQDAIDTIEAGKVEVSMGYDMELKPETGVTDSGENYEFIQTSLRMNHIALVNAARAGGQARIFDKERVQNMPKVKLLDGQTVAIEDENAAALIQQNFDSVLKRVKDAEEETENAKKEKEMSDTAAEMAKEEKDNFKEKFEKEKEKTNDAAIASLVAEVSKARDKALVIAGKDFVCDSYNVLTILRKALTDALPTIDWSNKSDDVVLYAADAQYGKKTEDMEEEEQKDKKAKDSHEKLGKDADTVTMTDGDPQSVRDSAYQQFMNGTLGKES